MINPRVFFDFSIKGGPSQRVVFELFQDVVPKTAENFRALCTGERGMSKSAPDRPLCYKGSVVHRIVPAFMIQGGDFILNNGKSGESIYGPQFEDENFQLDCDQEALLVMANRGPNTNNSQWFITLAPAEHLNGKHVVFGRVQSGFNVVQEIASLETDPKKHKPIGGDDAVKIVHCGELELKRKQPPTRDESAADSSRKHHRRAGSDYSGRSRSPSLSGRSLRSNSSSDTSQSSGAARRRRKKEKKAAKKAAKSHKHKKLRLKGNSSEEPASRPPTEEQLILQRIEREHREAEERRRADEAAQRLEEERRRKERAVEYLKNHRDAQKGGIILKGRGTMRYRDNDLGSGTRAWND